MTIMCNEVFNEDQRKHIDIVESIITRMSENSKQMKEWCIAISSAIVGISFTIDCKWFILMTIIVVVLFGYLDTYYLMLERQYRHLYDDIVKIGTDNKPCGNIPLYSTLIESYEKDKSNNANDNASKNNEDMKKTFKSKSIRPFYVTFGIGLILLFVATFFIPLEKEEQKVNIVNDYICTRTDSSVNVNVKSVDPVKVNFGEKSGLNVKITDTLRIKGIVKPK